jgi:hypothetical protein
VTRKRSRVITPSSTNGPLIPRRAPPGLSLTAPITPGFSPYTNAQICCFKCANLFLHENHRFPYRPILTLVMIVAAGFFVAGVGCSLALIIRELRKAPEVYEDEHGFYTVRNGAVKYGVPDSMKARRTRRSLNWAMNRTLRIKAFRVRGLPFFGNRVPHAASEFSATSRRRAGSCR